MLRYFILATALLWSATTLAQVETGKPLGKKNEFGVEATNFYALINPNFIASSPYLVTYRRHYGSWALRGGLGGRAIVSNTKGTDLESESRDLSLLISAGAERQILSLIHI